MSELRTPRRFAPRDDGCGGIVASRWVGCFEVVTGRNSLTPTHPTCLVFVRDGCVGNMIRKRHTLLCGHRCLFATTVSPVRAGLIESRIELRNPAYELCSGWGNVATAVTGGLAISMLL